MKQMIKKEDKIYLYVFNIVEYFAHFRGRINWFILYLKAYKKQRKIRHNLLAPMKTKKVIIEGSEKPYDSLRNLQKEITEKFYTNKNQ